MYLSYIDQFTIDLIYITFWLTLAIAMVFWFGKAFAWFINEVFYLKKETKKNYDTF